MAYRIYLMTNTVNGFRYVGQTTQSIRRRFRKHMTDRCNDLIQKDLDRYGEDSFQIKLICEVENKEEADEMEELMVHEMKSHRSLGKGYNKTYDGRSKIDEITRRGIVDRKLGVPCSEDHKRSISKTLTGRKTPESVKIKISEYLKKNGNPSAKKIKDSDTGKIYNCLKDCAEDIGVHYGTFKTRLGRGLYGYQQRFVRI